MMNLKAMSKQASLAILLSAIFATPLAYANDTSETQARMEALSYAPEGSFNDERFSQFELEQGADYSEHELTNSWLGMPAYSNDGKLIGYIEEAYLDEDGYVSEIIVGLSGDQGIIEIKGDLAELTNENVQFNLSNKQIAKLASSSQLASLK